MYNVHVENLCLFGAWAVKIVCSVCVLRASDGKRFACHEISAFLNDEYLRNRY